MKLEIEVNVADNVADKVQLEEYLRKEAIVALFSDGRIPAGKAARELGLSRIQFIEFLNRRGLPHGTYSADDWNSDALAIDAFEQRRAG